MGEVYTMKQWNRDRIFSAAAGQEIEAGIYNDMLNCMPPLDLPEAAINSAKRPVSAGFMMGEPYTANSAGNLLYMAFIKSGGHFYYLGLYEKD